MGGYKRDRNLEISVADSLNCDGESLKILIPFCSPILVLPKEIKR